MVRRLLPGGWGVRGCLERRSERRLAGEAVLGLSRLRWEADLLSQNSSVCSSTSLPGSSLLLRD